MSQIPLTAVALDAARTCIRRAYELDQASQQAVRAAANVFGIMDPLSGDDDAEIVVSLLTEWATCYRTPEMGEEATLEALGVVIVPPDLDDLALVVEATSGAPGHRLPPPPPDLADGMGDGGAGPASRITFDADEACPGR